MVSKRSIVAAVLAGFVVALACEGAVTVSDATATTAPATSHASTAPVGKSLPTAAGPRPIGLVRYDQLLAAVPIDALPGPKGKIGAAGEAAGQEAIKSAWAGKRITLNVVAGAPAGEGQSWSITSVPASTTAHGAPVRCFAHFQLRETTPMGDILAQKEGQSTAIRGTLQDVRWGNLMWQEKFTNGHGHSTSGPAMELTLVDCVLGKAADAELRGPVK